MAYTTIDDPSVHFQIKLYAGNGGSNTITNSGNSNLQADMWWGKERTSTSGHHIFDSSRGVGDNGKALIPNTNGAEGDDTAFRSFDSDGFTLANTGGFNESSQNYVAWQWVANGGSVSNDTNGDITTSVQANQTAGFSIATYTGNGGSNQTLGHGLGGEPEFVIFKDRDSTSHFRVFFKDLGASKFLNINTTDAQNTSSNIFPSKSSTTIGVEQNDVMNKNSSNHIMYCWRSIKGYSKFGKYDSNNNAFGPYIHCGFKPKLVVIKKITAVGEWHVLDVARERGDDTFPDSYGPTNTVDKDLYWSGNYSEGGSAQLVDFLANGFKLRNAHTGTNGENTNEDFIFMAWAEFPFVSSEGAPATAG